MSGPDEGDFGRLVLRSIVLAGLNTLVCLVVSNVVNDGWGFSGGPVGVFVAAALVGANIRVGLEDNLYLSKGVLATNGDLVERAVTILEAMNFNVMGPDEVRDQLDLVKHG